MKEIQELTFYHARSAKQKDQTMASITAVRGLVLVETGLEKGGGGGGGVGG